MIEKTGSAVWKGDLKGGSGTVSTQTRALSDIPYTFATRFEGKPGSNPEELIAAAHAACFSMALSGQLGRKGLTADSIETTATITLDASTGTITKSHLALTAKVPGASQADFDEAAGNAKKGCPVSKLLNAEITLDAKLS